MNDDAGNPFAELLEEYVAECAPLAQAVGDTLVTLERRWEEGDPADQLFGTLKGSLHTLKGNSAMMGLRPSRRWRTAWKMSAPFWESGQIFGLRRRGCCSGAPVFLWRW